MKVLQIHNRYREPGGEDAVVDAEAQLLRGAGQEVVQVQVRNPEGRVAAAGSLAFAPWNPISYRTITRLIDVHRPAIAHVHNTWFSLSPSAITALKRRNVAVVATIHNYRLSCANAHLSRDGSPCQLCVGSHAWHAVRYRCYRNSVVASAAAATTIQLNRRLGTWTDDVGLLLVPTEFVKARYVAAGMLADKIVVKPNHVPDPGPRRVPPSASRTVLYVGRVSTEKGAEVVLRAWDRAAAEGLDLVIVGDGPQRGELERRYPGAVFTGQLPAMEVSRLMLSARALVYPSQVYETFGRGIVEGLAASLPVVASNRGAPAEVVAPLGSSCLVPADDGDAWVEALVRIADDRFVDAAGLRGRAAYEASYTPAIGLDRLLEAYHQAILRSPNPSGGHK